MDNDSSPPKSLQNQSSIKKETATQRVYKDLRTKILTGAYNDGEQLRQDDLATQYGVSRIPVREALMQLSREALVSFSPFKGAEVTGLSAEELREIYEIRYALESVALRYSMSAMTDNDIRRLTSLVQAAHDSPPTESNEWSTMNWHFHYELYRIGGHPKLLSLIEAQHAAVDRYIRIYLQVMNYHADSLLAHQSILTCCTLRDLPGAILLLHEHLRESCCRICEYVYDRKDEAFSAPLYAPL